jgi:hypothetical protein
MSERMIEQRRARLLAQASAAVSPPVPNGTGATPATPRQAAAQAMRLEDAQMSRFLRLLQEARDDGQPGETAAFGPTVPTALARREIHRQGVGFADTAVAAVVSAAADRFLASILQQSIPCRDQRLKGLEVARQAAYERKRFRQKYEQDIADRRRRKAHEAVRRDHANRAAIRMAADMEAKGGGPAAAATTTTTANNNSNTINTAKRKTPDEGEDESSNNDNDQNGTNSKAKKAKTTTSSSPANGMIPPTPQQHTTTAAAAALRSSQYDDIDYDSIDEEDKRYIEHYADYDHDHDDDDGDNNNKKLKSNNNEDDDDDDDDDEHEAMILSDIARPLRAWGFNVDGKLASANILASTVVDAAIVADDSESDDGEAGPTATASVEESSMSNGQQQLQMMNGDGGPKSREDGAETGATLGKLNTGNTSSIPTESPVKKTTPKSGDATVNATNTSTTTTKKSPSATTTNT